MPNLSISEVSNIGSMNTISTTNKDRRDELNLEAVDYNDNCITNKITEQLKNVKFEPTTGHNDSITALVPEIKKLCLTQDEKSYKPERLAGYIKAVIPPTGTVVIQMASGSKILDVGTVIFVKKSINADEVAKVYQEIGFISDVFGSVNEPMYSMELKQKSLGELLMMDSKVFYLDDHPSTTYVNIEHDANDHYTVIYE